MNSNIILGIDIGGTKTAVILGDQQGKIHKKESFPTSNVTNTLESIKNIISKFNLNGPYSIGISCGGPLDSLNGIIQSPPNLPGWDNIKITKIISEFTNQPAYLMNDANAGALAEMYFGAGKGFQNIIFLTMGTGMGGGLILNGKLYEGTTGDAGEIGHIRMNESGPLGYNKFGSFEGFCSGSGISQLGREYAKKFGNQVSFYNDNLELITTKTIAEAANKGDLKAIEIFDISSEYLGKGLAVLIDILNPELILLGSIYIRSGHLFQKKLNEVLKKECLPRNLNACKVLPAALNENIGDLAALSIAIYYQNQK